MFAVAVGTAAAVMRVRRDEMEKGQSAQETWETLKRYVNLHLALEDSLKSLKYSLGRSALKHFHHVIILS